MSLPRDSPLNRARSLAPWILPSVLIHLGLVAFWLTLPARPVQVEQPVPDWAILLVASPVDEAPPVDLPASPAHLDEPPAPEPEVVLPSAPGAVGAVEPQPNAPAPEGLVAPGERAPTRPPNPGPITFGPRYRAAERLRPDIRDNRLYAPLPEEIVGLSEAQKAQLDLRMILAEVSDSVYALEAAGKRMTDWTYTDKNGRRWGISPGPHGPQLELGGLVIPIPFGFSVPVTAEAARRAWMDADVASQANRAEARLVLKDRAAEIRRRRDAERSRAKVDTASSKPPSTPRDDPPRTVR